MIQPITKEGRSYWLVRLLHGYYKQRSRQNNLVGIDRVTFLKELVKYQVSLHHYDVNEIDTDVENA